MIKLKDILNERSSPNAKKLRIFDFDDTLVSSNSRVGVIKPDGSKVWLTPGEYAIYNKKAGESYDYSEFSKLIDPKEIKAMMKVFKIFHDAKGERRLAVLTARGHDKPIREFLQDIGFNDVEIIALDDSDPQKKADWIEERIKEGFDDVFFADDSYKNINAVSKLKQKYPHVRWELRLVKYR